MQLKFEMHNNKKYKIKETYYSIVYAKELE